MAEQIEQLARFVAETRLEDIPDDVRAQAKMLLLDTFGVILAGSEQREVRALRERLQATAGSGATVYARGAPVTDPGRAALLNGLAARSIELCEGHVELSCQAAVQTHGGMGVTDEMRVGHYFKRTTMLDSTYGNVDCHLRRFTALNAKAAA